MVLESTTYPGTTEDVVRPILEESGLIAGRDFSLVYSPERIDPGMPAAESYLRPRLREGDLVLTLGAGDVDGLGRELVAR